MGSLPSVLLFPFPPFLRMDWPVWQRCYGYKRPVLPYSAMGMWQRDSETPATQQTLGLGADYGL